MSGSQKNDIELTCSQEDSRVNQSPLRESKRLKKIQDGFGLPSNELLAVYDPESSSLKMSQDSAMRQKARRLGRSCGIWPRSGTMQSGKVFQRVPLVRLTKEIGSGLLPTLTTKDAGRGPSICQSRRGMAMLPSHLGGPISPQYAEQMMGFPKDWTKLELNDLETPSSPKSRK